MTNLRLVPAPVVLDRSALMTAYNAAMGLARKGLLDPMRVRRGLGLAMSRSFDPGKYHTTPVSCWCPDFDPRKGNHSCKHHLAVSFRELATVRRAA